MTTAASARKELRRLLEERTMGKAVGWFNDAVHASDIISLNQSAGQLRKALGRRHLVAGFSEREHAHVQTPWGPMRYGGFRVDEGGRAWLMASVASKQNQPFAFLFNVYDQGDTETRVATLRALNFVEGENVEAALTLIRDAGRTYLDELLSAAWCNNPFSSKHLSDLEYRKAVLKAVFCEVPIEGFIGLEERADEEMATSLNDFANEREAAGRPVPDAVWIVSALRPKPGLVARLIGRLEHPLPKERIVAARALRNAADARAQVFLEERLEREDDPMVIRAIEAALNIAGAD